MTRWFIFLFSLAFYAHATEILGTDSFSRRFKNLGFSAGTLTEFVGFTQINDKGDRGKFAWNPYLGFSADIEINPTWTMIPEINWVLPREAGNSGISKNLFMFRMDAAHSIFDQLRLRYGTSFMVLNTRGPGGTAEINNGTGTSSFYVPKESQTAINQTLDVGMDLIYESISIRFQTFIYSPFNNLKRQWSYAIGVTYFYDLWTK